MMSFSSLSSFETQFGDNRPAIIATANFGQIESRTSRISRRITQDSLGASQASNFFSVVDPNWPSETAAYLNGQNQGELASRLLNKIRSDNGDERVRMLLCQAAIHKGENAFDFAIDLLAQVGDALLYNASRPLRDLSENAWYIILGAIARSSLNSELKEKLIQRWVGADAVGIRDAVVHALGALAYYDPKARGAREILVRMASSDPEPSIRVAASMQLDDLA